MERDKLLGTMDAKVWTDEFMATKARLGNKEFDHAMMLSWFANAIMAGFDEANRRAQRALDAERERVAFLDKKNVALVEASNLVLKVKAEQDAQLATLQAQVKQLGRTLADVYQQRDGLQAQLADRDAMILQMGEQAAVLAKENMAVKAQLRQVEGENELLKSGQRYMALGKERDTLRQLVEEADELYTHYGLLANPGYTGPINIFEWIGKVRAAKDAGKETDNDV